MPSPAVAGILSANFIEARHHTDHPDGDIAESNQAFQLEKQGDPSLPYYMLVHPESGEVFGTFSGFALTTKAFTDFLEAGVAKSAQKKVAVVE